MSVIVLNANGQFWREANVKWAIKKWIKNKIEIVEADKAKEYKSVSIRVKLPLVVRLLELVKYKPKHTKIPFSAMAIYNRDNNICQYWHKTDKGKKFKYKCSEQDRTIDHIVPISKGGENSFKNCVCSCRNCNEIIKKNHTPEEAGLELIRKPIIPVRRDEYITFMRFTYNEKKLAHKIYYEKWLGKKFSHII